jgi:hypothetical protein
MQRRLVFPKPCLVMERLDETIVEAIERRRRAYSLAARQDDRAIERRALVSYPAISPGYFGQT